MHIDDRRLLTLLSKDYVVRHTQLKPRDFKQTHDQAWISLAARLLAGPARRSSAIKLGKQPITGPE